MINILFIGDIVGQDGRNIVFKFLPELKEKYNIDFTIVNGENSAHGKGITSKIYKQFINNGIDAITLGNHSFSKQEIKNDFNDLDRLIRPYNLEIEKELGKGFRVFDVKGLKLGILNIMGKVFMHNVFIDPFETMSYLLFQEKIREKYKIDLLLVDLHAEATSEKVLFGHYFKNHLIATLGTHTHVQTADDRIIDGMAYISDVGMCGVFDSVIGRDIDEMIESMIYHNKTHYTLAKGEAILCGVVIEIDETTKRATNIERIQIRP